MSMTDDPTPLPRPAETALFLDFDGTLVEIAPTPESVVAAPGLADLLARLDERLGGALAVVSGRPVEQIDGFLAPLRLPVAGLHGLDCRLADGRRVRRVPDGLEPALDRARQRFGAFVADRPGTRLEDKALTVALHYRLAPAAEAAARALAAEVAAGSGGLLEVRTGKMVLELAPPGRTKGDAVRDLLGEPPFRGRRPVFCGDDVTDEDGFRAVAAMGGLGIRVGDPSVPTAACGRLADVQAMLDWLQALAERA
ncbi:MAG TPA: trehalose-phosphatase [Geminicoccaceae bacterium]|nr:trehalose-phosphatase [Geminicoccaceae bacterium]